ncbi:MULTISPECIES: Ig-like domain-containing protein [unclassified Nocardioides]|uniref:Ig-like domain-containing protein n=1 Tax=unclassified Nocardioides TaxID=2615069 RepID=UPI00361A5FDA
MRTLARLSFGLGAALLGTSLLSAGAATAAEPAPPVVVADTVTLWPGQMTDIDVLANDTSPSGDDLALCRFPEPDFFAGGPLPSVIVSHDSAEVLADGATGPGSVVVSAMPRARGTHVVDYYVCDHTRLVPATLTVVVRDVQPVDVAKVRGKKGRLKVTNHNDRPIRLWYGHPQAFKEDGRVKVPAGATRTVEVQRHRIAWMAVIGQGAGKKSILSSPGIADHGVVRDIRLKGEPLPRPKGADSAVSEPGRWLA